MHEGKKRWVQTTSVHIVQASKCSVCLSVCTVWSPPPTWHAHAPEWHPSAGSFVLSGCLCSAPQKALSWLWFALLPRFDVPTLVCLLSSLFIHLSLLSVPFLFVTRYLFRVVWFLNSVGVFFFKINFLKIASPPSSSVPPWPHSPSAWLTCFKVNKAQSLPRSECPPEWTMFPLTTVSHHLFDGA